MLPPDDFGPSERLKAGRGKSDRLRTSRVAEGVDLSSHARRLSAISTSRRFSENGPQSGDNSCDSCQRTGPGIPAPYPRRPLELHHAAPLMQPPYRRLQLLRGEQPGEKQKAEIGGTSPLTTGLLTTDHGLRTTGRRGQGKV
jgi:hypothetical protein